MKILESLKCRDLTDLYVDFIVNIFKDSISNNLNKDFKVVIDTANGATYKVAERIFTNLE